MYYTWGSQNSFNSSYFSIQHQNLGFDFIPEQYYGLYHYDCTNAYRNFFTSIPLQAQRSAPPQNMNQIKKEETQMNPQFKIINDVKLQKDEQKKIRNEEQKNMKIWNQKKGRNINSNIFRAMLKFLLSENCSKEFLKKIVSHHKIKITPEHYQCQIRYITKKFKNHVRNQEIQQFLCGNHQEEQINFITRIMMKIYLKKIHVLYAFNSKKIQDQTRPLHLIFCHSLLKTVLK